MTYFWLALFIVLILIEIATLALTTVWFAAGALTATFISLAGGPLWLQIVLFVLISLVLLFFTRPYAVKYFNKGRVKTNLDEIIGKQVIVTEEINNLKGQGEVVINGLPWTARSANDGCVIEKDRLVVINAINGVKVIVEPVKETD